MSRIFQIFAGLIAVSIIFLTILGQVPQVSAWLVSEYLIYRLALKPLAPPLATAIVGGLVAWLVLRVNAAINIRNKRIDVIVHCNSRYDELYKLRMEIEHLRSNTASFRGGALSATEREQIAVNRRARAHMAKSYFRRYWGLKSDQLDYWFSGYVDPETLTSWFMSTAKALAPSLDDAAALDYHEHLDEILERHGIVDQRFVDLVKFIRESVAPVKDRQTQYAALLHYLRIIERDERSLIRQLTRHSLHRFSVPQLESTLIEPYQVEYDRISPQGWFGKKGHKAANFCRHWLFGWARTPHTSDEIEGLKSILEKKRMTEAINIRLVKS